MSGTSRLSARTRLTVWYALLLGVMTAAFSVAIFLAVRAVLGRQIHAHLQQSLDVLERTAREQPSELAELDEHVAVRYFRVEAQKPVGWVSSSWRGLNLDALLGETRPAPGSIRGTAGGRPFRIETRTITLDGAAALLAVGEEESLLAQALETLVTTLAIGLPLMLAVAVVAGRILAGRVLSPLGEMATTANRLTADRLSERLPVSNPGDEFGQLATAFNAALGRIEEAFERLRRFTSDASHQLRTPLTALRSVGEVGMQEGASPEEMRETIGSMLEEVRRLTRLVDGLLTLTRAESGRLPLETGPVEVAALTREVADYVRVLAEEKRQALSLHGEGPLLARADRPTLGQAIVNVLENAVKYAPSGGHVEVQVLRRGAEAVVEVRDDGPGIAPEDSPHIFERFYRGAAGSANGSGTGLGLAIAKWAAQLNGGRIELETKLGRGSTFRIVVPAVPHEHERKEKP
jgi:heavy metal sensor kinase